MFSPQTCAIMSFSVWGTVCTNIEWLPRRLRCHCGQAHASLLHSCSKNSSSWGRVKGRQDARETGSGSGSETEICSGRKQSRFLPIHQQQEHLSSKDKTWTSMHVNPSLHKNKERPREKQHLASRSKGLLPRLHLSRKISLLRETVSLKKSVLHSHLQLEFQNSGLIEANGSFPKSPICRFSSSTVPLILA